METDDDGDLLILSLATGQVVIELLPDVAPLHVARVLELARSGAYDNVAFHRVIEGFVAQTGDVQFGDLEDGFDPALVGRGGSALPDLPAEFSDISFERGVVGMARAADPDSANSQFFIMFDAEPSLDGRFTVFGRVVEGMEHVDAIKRGDPANNGAVTDPDRMLATEIADSDDADGVSPEEAQTVALLYEAGLGREAAFAGLNFWIDRFEDGASLTAIAQAFLDSDEFAGNVGEPETLDDGAFVTALFENVIGRGPAPAGFDFWTGRLADGASRAETLLAFAIAPENAGQSPRVETLAPVAMAEDPTDALREDIEPEWFFTG